MQARRFWSFLMHQLNKRSVTVIVSDSKMSLLLFSPIVGLNIDFKQATVARLVDESASQSAPQQQLLKQLCQTGRQRDRLSLICVRLFSLTPSGNQLESQN